MPASDSGSEYGVEGFSKKRMCIGICGVFPAALWTAVLMYLSYKENKQGGTCPHMNACGEDIGHIVKFINGSMAAFAALVAVELIEGCVAGEHDLATSPVEMLINLVTGVIFLFIYGWNYFGIVQLWTAQGCTPGLLTAGWVVLIGNNIVWFMTVGSMIGAALFGAAVGAADWATGDRL